jgi:hypothetical protein
MIGHQVLLAMVQVATHHWIGEEASQDFPASIFRRRLRWRSSFPSRYGRQAISPRRHAGRAGAGTLVYALFIPISFGRVIASPWLVTPQFFPRIFRPSRHRDPVRSCPGAANIASISTRGGKWANEAHTHACPRVDEVAIGGMLASVLDLCDAYPSRQYGAAAHHGVGPLRYATCGILLILLPASFDMRWCRPHAGMAPSRRCCSIVMMCSPDLFVEWDDRNLIITGFSLLLGVGGLFVAGDAYQALLWWSHHAQAGGRGRCAADHIHAILNRDGSRRVM